MVLKVGDRVQVNSFFLKSRSHLCKNAYVPKLPDTCGVFDGIAHITKRGYQLVKPGRVYCYVKWLTGKSNPPYVRQIIRLEYLEPYGTPR